MPQGLLKARSDRHRQMIALLAEAPCGLWDLQQRLPGKPSRGTVLADLAYLEVAFPSRIIREPVHKGGRGAPTIRYSWRGSLPIRLEPTIEWVLQEELSGLVLAQSLVRQLGSVEDERLHLGRLLDHPQLRGSVQLVAGGMVELSHFGVEPQDPAIVLACLMATLNQQYLIIHYEGLRSTSIMHVAPLRMVLIRNEWYCIAWLKHLRSLRLSRFRLAQITDDPPPGMPCSITPEEVDALLAPAFYATSSTRAADLVRVVLGISPDGWRQVQGRSWGLDQEIDETPEDLPEGWRRIAFTTAGLMECRHWVLALGNRVVIEEPASLREWIVEQAEAILARHQGRPPEL